MRVGYRVVKDSHAARSLKLSRLLAGERLAGVLALSTYLPIAAKLAEMETKCEAARGLLYKVGMAIDEGVEPQRVERPHAGQEVARGHRVAICDQVGDPNGRALVERLEGERRAALDSLHADMGASRYASLLDRLVDAARSPRQRQTRSGFEPMIEYWLLELVP